MQPVSSSEAGLQSAGTNLRGKRTRQIEHMGWEIDPASGQITITELHVLSSSITTSIHHSNCKQEYTTSHHPPQGALRL